MIEIFVPVLWICINANCEFMQDEQHYTRESECKHQIDKQKAKIKKLAKEAKSQVDTLEGTCISVSIRKSMI
jgi:hypothetical protein